MRATSYLIVVKAVTFINEPFILPIAHSQEDDSTAPISFRDAIKSASPAPLVGNEPRLVRFGPIGVEPKAEYRGRNKVLYTFDQAQASVASWGLRLLTFREVMERCIIPGLEGKLDDQQRPVVDDMFASDGEWVDNAFYLKDGTLYVSTGIAGLRWDAAAGEYDARGMTMSEQPRAYDVHGLAVDWNPIRKVGKTAPQLVVDLYGRPVEDLPSRIQQEGGVVLPPEDVVRPGGRGVNGDYLIAGTDYYIRAARGGKIFAPQETGVAR